MSRYIDADKLVTHLKDELEGCKKPVGGRACGKSIAYGTALGLTMAISFAETLSTADVVEVVHASWNWEKQNGLWGYYCTNCHAGFVDSENVEWIAKSHDYCPKCGAKMDGERSEK